jgi:hypothetical protein
MRVQHAQPQGGHTHQCGLAARGQPRPAAVPGTHPAHPASPLKPGPPLSLPAHQQCTPSLRVPLHIPPHGLGSLHHCGVAAPGPAWHRLQHPFQPLRSPCQLHQRPSLDVCMNHETAPHSQPASPSHREGRVHHYGGAGGTRRPGFGWRRRPAPARTPAPPSAAPSPSLSPGTPTSGPLLPFEHPAKEDVGWVQHLGWTGAGTGGRQPSRASPAAPSSLHQPAG